MTIPAAATHPSFAPDLTLRPLHPARRVNLIEREIREKLSRSALELLLGVASVISEGQAALVGSQKTFTGSTMITIELSRLATTLREAPDARTARRLSALWATDAIAQARIRAIAAREIERQTGVRPRSFGIDVEVRSSGPTLLIDVNVEARL